MQCPNCSKTVKEGTSICPHCDAVLDESILGAMPSDDAEGEDTPPPAPAPKKPASKPTRRPAPISGTKPKPSASAVEGKPYAGKYSQYWTEEDGAAPSKAASRSEEASALATKAAADSASASTSEGEDPLREVRNIWKSFLDLHFEDKVTAAMGAASFVVAFFPWRSTLDEGDDMGMFTWGFWTALLGLVSILCIWLRKSGKLPGIPRSLMPLSAVGAGGLSLLIGAIYAFTAYEKGVKVGKAVVISEPAFGVFCAILCAGGLIVGGMLTLKREK
jgi:hypothetical protein